MAERRSAVIAAIPIPSGLERIRRVHVPVARAGVPPHVTILFPFVPAGALTEDDRRRAAAIASTVPAFDVAFASVGRFDDALYLEPAPAEPFRRLTLALAAAWPAYPPYANSAFGVDDIVPHLSLSTSDPAAFDDLAGVSQRFLPFERRVGRLSVIVEEPSGRWRTRWRIPLRP